MTEITDHGEFWLPSEFLPEDFFLDEKVRFGESMDDSLRFADGDGLPFPIEFPYDYHSSNLSSPVELMTERVSDKDELYMSGLPRQMAQTFLHHQGNKNHCFRSFPSLSPFCQNKWMSMACPPQSPPCSSASRSKIPPKISCPSPLVTNAVDKDWEDMLLKLAGTGMRSRLGEDTEEKLLLQRQPFPSHRGLLGTPLNPCIPLKTSNGSDAAYHRRTSLTPHQLKQLQIQKQRHKSSVDWGNPESKKEKAVGGTMVGCLQGSYTNNNVGSRLYGRSPNANNGMRAVFLATPALRKQSCGGTGVFLPRSLGCPTELRNKPACSTVLLPARVVKALNLNLDEMVPDGRVPGGFILDHDTMLTRNNCQWLSQKKVFLPQPSRMHTKHHELRLPSEWTY